MTSGGGSSQGFLETIVDEFGLQWTQIAVFTSLVLGSFSLSKYFNTGSWMIATIVAFGVVHVFRRQIPGRLILVSLAALAFIVAALGAFAVLLWQKHIHLGSFLMHNRTGTSAYLGAAIMMPFAAVTLSYRRQEMFLGGGFPESVSNAIRQGLVDTPFYRREQVYEWTAISHTVDLLKVRVRLSYYAVNRTAVDQWLDVVFTPMRRDVRFLVAKIGGTAYDTDDPQFRNESGLKIRSLIPANAERFVELEDEVDYRLEDSDLYATYFPTTGIRLVVNNALPDVRVVVESLFQAPVLPQITNSTRIYDVPTGVLPYQGFKVDWFKTSTLGPTGSVT